MDYAYLLWNKTSLILIRICLFYELFVKEVRPPDIRRITDNNKESKQSFISTHIKRNIGLERHLIEDLAPLRHNLNKPNSLM